MPKCSDNLANHFAAVWTSSDLTRPISLQKLQVGLRPPKRTRYRAPARALSRAPGNSELESAGTRNGTEPAEPEMLSPRLRFARGSLILPPIWWVLRVLRQNVRKASPPRRLPVGRGGDGDASKSRKVP